MSKHKRNQFRQPNAPTPSDLVAVKRIGGMSWKLVAAITSVAVTAFIGVFIATVATPKITLEGVSGGPVNDLIEKGDEHLQLMVWRLTVKNRSLIPGYVDKVSFEPANATSKKIRLELLRLDRPTLYYWSDPREIEVRAQTTIVTTDAEPAKDHPQFQIQAYDNKGQPIGGHTYTVMVVAKRNTSLGRTKEPGELYETLRQQKRLLRLNEAGDQKVIQRVIARGDSDAEAYFRIGSMYETGDMLPQDLVEAILWYERAAGEGHEAAHLKAKQLAEPLFGPDAIRTKVLTAFYLVDVANRLRKVSYRVSDVKKATSGEGTMLEAPAIARWPGKMKLIVCINPDHRVAESNTNNNCEEKAFTVSASTKY